MTLLSMYTAHTAQAAPRGLCLFCARFPTRSLCLELLLELTV